MPHIKTQDGMELYCELYGGEMKGMPIVLLHPGFANGSFWKFQLALATNRPVLIIDLLGHGKSSVPESGYGIVRMAAQVAHVIRHFFPHGRVILIGNSLGGQVAMQLLVSEFAHRVAGAVLISTHTNMAKGATPQQLRKKNLAKHLDGMKGVWLGPGASDEVRAMIGGFKAWMKKERPHVLNALLMDEDGPTFWDVEDALRSVDTPVLVVGGTCDKVILPIDMRRLKDMIPGSEYLMFEGIGHFAPVEDPLRLNSAVEWFIDSIN